VPRMCTTPKLLKRAFDSVLAYAGVPRPLPWARRRLVVEVSWFFPPASAGNVACDCGTVAGNICEVLASHLLAEHTVRMHSKAPLAAFGGRITRRANGEQNR